MPLVNYTSDSDTSRASTPPRKRKKPRTTSPTLPPLPPSFHDLYAATVRTTTHDTPALHQGRVRQTPHTPGAWPSHIYIEWHPPAATHTLLATLIAALQATYTTTTSSSSSSSDANSVPRAITSFLHSDLGTPQPLHISLSRPLMLGPAVRDAFPAAVRRAVQGSGAAAAAAGLRLRCGRAQWHRTGESARSFLVLRGDGGGDGDGDEGGNPNPELTALLRRCNGVVAGYGQPELYRWAEDGGEREVGGAFHVSIAWSFAEPTEELRAATEQIFGEKGVGEKLHDVEIPVDGVKVKIGNIVTHVALPQPGRQAGGMVSRNIFGL
ncbi:hypothetical protein BT67DRAFT_488054 [Trichocladium antarcticum]|uniref:U6 snRNA phosphodiesterase n=1 Tax=Trichocladium antarcticum TaxID=1450529 RepID=A0AAN6UPK3_9PEZI|nr:hypothetical protein BT67DRAFT_488054 [Trichocladium antarcticum]